MHILRIPHTFSSFLHQYKLMFEFHLSWIFWSALGNINWLHSFVYTLPLSSLSGLNLIIEKKWQFRKTRWGSQVELNWLPCQSTEYCHERLTSERGQGLPSGSYLQPLCPEGGSSSPISKWAQLLYHLTFHSLNSCWLSCCVPFTDVQGCSEHPALELSLPIIFRTKAWQ